MVQRCTRCSHLLTTIETNPDVEEDEDGVEDEVEREEDKERRDLPLTTLSRSHPTPQRHGHAEDA